MKKISEFKKHKAKVDARHATIDRDFHFWIEHIVHWHLALLALSLVLFFSFLLFDPRAPAWASF
ncbi:MAG: hypothetical protein P1P90_05895 [Patescibacteria group bacterium]|nr:hypothetical protein [Patescibacteria group bacterium]